MDKPRLLDCFCGGGGASMGYVQAGFEVVGVDIKPQPRYPFAFIQADALDVLYAFAHGDCWSDQSGHDWHLEDFDAIHASPPCQYYTRLRYLPWLRDKVYWRSIPPTRDALQRTRCPYIIENVADAGWDMIDSMVLCGKALGLSLYRHRRFEVSFGLILAMTHPAHTETISSGHRSLGQQRGGLNGWGGVAGHQGGVKRHRQQMGIDWMTGEELSQAVPPIMTKLVGEQLLRYLEAR